MAAVTRNGQTPPQEDPDVLGIQPGQAILRQRTLEEAFRRWRGYLRGKIPEQTTDEVMRVLRGE